MEFTRPTANEQVPGLWEKRWRAADAGQMTLVGKMITACKQRTLADVVGKLECEGVIEVGCGLGFTFEVLSRLRPEAVGIDVSEAAVEFCCSRGLKVRQGALEDVVEKYDLVVSDGMLEHFPDFAPYARKLMELASKYVILIQTDHDSAFAKLLFVLEGIFRRGKNVPELDYGLADFIAAFSNGGFELVTSRALFLGSFRLLLFQRTS